MAYSKDFKIRAIAYKNEGHTKTHVCEVFDIPPMTLTRWMKRLEATGELDNYYPSTRSGKIDMKKLEKDFEDNPNKQLHERAPDYNCTKQAIFYAKKRLKITRKKTLSHTSSNQ